MGLKCSCIISLGSHNVNACDLCVLLVLYPLSAQERHKSFANFINDCYRCFLCSYYYLFICKWGKKEFFLEVTPLDVLSLKIQNQQFFSTSDFHTHHEFKDTEDLLYVTEFFTRVNHARYFKIRCYVYFSYCISKMYCIGLLITILSLTDVYIFMMKAHHEVAEGVNIKHKNTNQRYLCII